MFGRSELQEIRMPLKLETKLHLEALHFGQVIERRFS